MLNLLKHIADLKTSMIVLMISAEKVLRLLRLYRDLTQCRFGPLLSSVTAVAILRHFQ